MYGVKWSPGVTMEMMEETTIKQALAYFRGNKTRTAEALGIAIRTIDNKLEKYGIENPKDELAIQNGLEHVKESVPEVEQLPVPEVVTETKMRGKKK